MFNPYTGIKTNILFFTKGKPTKDIWYYEHPYPAGVKNYSKTKPMKFEEFKAEQAWWSDETDGFAARVENEQAWRVDFTELRNNAELKAKPNWDKAASLNAQASELKDSIESLKQSLTNEEEESELNKDLLKKLKKDRKNALKQVVIEQQA